MLRYFFCKVICICQNSSVAGRQPPGEVVGEGCSVPAAYQIGRSSISNILGNSWGLPIHVLRVFWICFITMGSEICSSILAQTLYVLGHFWMFVVKIIECVFSLKSSGLLTPTYP